MAKPKKTKAVPLDKVQLSYIRQHMHSTTAEDIAADLKIPPARVRRQVEKFRAEDAANPPPPPPEGAGQPAVRTPTALERMQYKDEDGRAKPGVTVMTGAQSMANDDAVGASPFGVGQLTEAQRAYIVEKKGKLPVEQIAKDVGLLPFQVSQFMETLDPDRRGREDWFKRNKDHLHKIRPDKPTL